MIVRRLYSLVWFLALPWIRRYLKKRARQAPAYLEHWDERFGRAVTPISRNAIWVHAVSVGETRAALPLITALKERWPGVPLLVTQMTPTGRATALQLYGDEAEVRYLPYDFPDAVQRFIEVYRPKFGVLMETELWPNLIHAARQAGVPLFLANARLSAKSLKGYRRITWLIRPAVRALTAIAAQSDDDAQRLALLGADRIAVCGNTKYDFTPPQDQLVLGDQFRQLMGRRQVLVCASTRQGEELLILQAWKQQTSDCLLILVPRHPERFNEVGALAQEHGFSVQYRSDGKPVEPSTRVWIGDSMGEMFAYYRAADLVFIGGSLLPLGGQNLIEPASIGIPVLMGPSTFNFSQASRLAFACQAALQVEDASDLVVKVNELLGDPDRRCAMHEAALDFSVAHRGASRRIVEMIATSLQSSGEEPRQ
jgi:3-deoxy-D-manno-octulosonic-acid transferase